MKGPFQINRSEDQISIVLDVCFYYLFYNKKHICCTSSSYESSWHVIHFFLHSE